MNELVSSSAEGRRAAAFSSSSSVSYSRAYGWSVAVDASVTPPEVGTVTRRGGEARGRAGGRKRILKRERRVEADRGLSLSDGRQQ